MKGEDTTMSDEPTELIWTHFPSMQNVTDEEVISRLRESLTEVNLG